MRTALAFSFALVSFLALGQPQFNSIPWLSNQYVVYTNLTHGLTSWYAMTEGSGTTIHDLQSGLNGTLETCGWMSATPGPGPCVIIGNGGDIVAPSQGQTNFSLAASTITFSWLCWWTNTSFTANTYAFHIQGGTKGPPSDIFGCALKSNNEWNFTAAAFSWSIGPTFFSGADWGHWMWCVLEYSSGACNFYTNGVFVGTTTGITCSGNNNGSLIIGSPVTNSAGGAQSWRGKMADFRIYNNYLPTQAEISQMAGYYHSLGWF